MPVNSATCILGSNTSQLTRKKKNRGPLKSLKIAHHHRSRIARSLPHVHARIASCAAICRASTVHAITLTAAAPICSPGHATRMLARCHAYDSAIPRRGAFERAPPHDRSRTTPIAHKSTDESYADSVHLRSPRTPVSSAPPRATPPDPMAAAVIRMRREGAREARRGARKARARTAPAPCRMACQASPSAPRARWHWRRARRRRRWRWRHGICKHVREQTSTVSRRASHQHHTVCTRLLVERNALCDVRACSPSMTAHHVAAPIFCRDVAVAVQRGNCASLAGHENHRRRIGQPAATPFGNV